MPPKVEQKQPFILFEANEAVCSNAQAFPFNQNMKDARTEFIPPKNQADRIFLNPPNGKISSLSLYEPLASTSFGIAVVPVFNQFSQRWKLFSVFIQKKQNEMNDLQKSLPDGIKGSTEIDLLERSLTEIQTQFQFFQWIANHQSKLPRLSDEALLTDFFDAIEFEEKKALAEESGLSSVIELEDQIEREKAALQTPNLSNKIVSRKAEFDRLIAQELRLRDRTLYRQESQSSGGNTEVVAYKNNEFARIYYENIMIGLRIASNQSSHLSFLADQNKPDKVLRRIESEPWMRQLDFIASTSFASRVEYQITGNPQEGALLESVLPMGVMFIPHYGHPIGMAITAAELLRIHLQNKDLFGNNATPRRAQEADFNAGMMALAAIPKIGKPLAAALAFTEFASIAQTGKDLAGNEVAGAEAALSGVVALMSVLVLGGRGEEANALSQKLNGYLKKAQAAYPKDPKLANQKWVDLVARDLREVSKEDPAVLQEAIELLKKNKRVKSHLKEFEDATAKLYPKMKSVSRSTALARAGEPPIPDLPGRRVNFYQDYALRHINPRPSLLAEKGSTVAQRKKNSPRPVNLKGSHKPFNVGTYRPHPDENATFIKSVEGSQLKALVSAELRNKFTLEESKQVEETVALLQKSGVSGQVRLQHKGKSSEQVKNKELGRGGMATVYEGEFIPAKGKPFDVAIKVYDRPELLGSLPVNPAHRAFSPLTLQLDEAANLARFWEKGMGPGYVNILQLEDGRIGIVMRKIKGIHQDKLSYAKVFEKVRAQMPDGTDLKDVHQKVGEVFDSLAEQYRKQFGIITNDMKIQLPDFQAVSEIDLRQPNLARLIFMDLARVEKILPYEDEISWVRAMNIQNNAWVESFRTRKYGEKVWEGTRWDLRAIESKGKLSAEQSKALLNLAQNPVKPGIKMRVLKDRLGNIQMVTLDLLPGRGYATGAPIVHIDRDGKIETIASKVQGK